MLNGFGAPQRIAVIGATSDIGNAILENILDENITKCFLVARDTKSSQQLVGTHKGMRGTFESVEIDACSEESRSFCVEKIFEGGDLDVAIIAIGILGQELSKNTLENSLELLEINSVANVHLLTSIAYRMEKQKHGTVIVISSFAVVRPRLENFAYGASKAALDFYSRGLAEKLKSSNVKIRIIRPGFVRTKMTAHMKDGLFACEADVVGRAGKMALSSKKVVIYSPYFLKYVAGIVRILPSWILARFNEG